MSRHEVLNRLARAAALLLCSLCIVSVQAQATQGAAAGPVMSKMMAADAHPAFEVATIKPSDPNDPSDGWHANGRQIFYENQTVSKMILFAYGVRANQVVGAPAWVETDRFDIHGVPDIDGQPNTKQQ